MIRNKNFFDELEPDWDDVITDTYANAYIVKPQYDKDRNGYKIIGKFKHEKDLSLEGRSVLDDDLYRIELLAFSECTNLNDKLLIPASVTYIGMNAFVKCENILELEFEEGHLEEIETYAFAGLKKIKSVILPQSLKKLHSLSFSNCTSLETVVLPDRLRGLNTRTFENCTSLREIKMPSKLYYIEEGVFNNCTSLEQLVIPPSVKRIDDGAFITLKPEQIINKSHVKLLSRHFTASEY